MNSRRYFVLLLLVMITLVTFVEVRKCEFINLDDDLYITNNFNIHDGLTWKTVKWAFTADLVSDSPNADYWQPVTFLVRILMIENFGLDPARHHLANLFFHILNTLILFHILYRLTGFMGRSAFVAALFAIHPQHVESVAWATELKDVLSGLFWMLTIWAYLRYIALKSLGRYAAMLGIFVLGLMTKPWGMTLPFVLLLLDYWPLGRARWSFQDKALWMRLILEKCPLLFLGILSAVLTWRAQAFNLTPMSVPDGIIYAPVGYISYLLKTFVPTPLAAWYPHPGFAFSQLVGSWLLVIGISVWILWRAKRYPYLFVGWWWFIGVLVPVVWMGIIARADRFSYLSLIGVFIMITWGVTELVRRWQWSSFVLKMMSATAVFVLMVMSFFQVSYWRNSITILQHTLSVTKNNYSVYNYLGLALMDQGKFKEADQHFIESLHIRSNDPLIHNNYAGLLILQGRMDVAKEHCEKALRINPDFALAHNNLGNVLFHEGKFNEAMVHYRHALQMDSCFLIARSNLALTLARLGKFDEAIRNWNEVLEINPKLPDAHYNIAKTLRRQGKEDEAIKHFEIAARLQGRSNAPWRVPSGSSDLSNRSQNDVQK